MYSLGKGIRSKKIRTISYLARYFIVSRVPGKSWFMELAAECSGIEREESPRLMKFRVSFGLVCWAFVSSHSPE